MKITIHYHPCLLQEAMELVHAFVNQIPVEQMTGQGSYCIPVEELIKIRAIACEGLCPESEAMQFFFRGVHFEDKGDGLLSIARCMVYSLSSEHVADVDTAVKRMRETWAKYRGAPRINNISVYGIGFAEEHGEQFHSLSREVAKLPVPVAFQLQLVEALTDYDTYLLRLMDLLWPVIEKLEPLLEPWVEKCRPLAEQWETYLSSEHNLRDFFMRKLAMPEPKNTELTLSLHYIKASLGLVFFANLDGAAHFLMGVGNDVGLIEPVTPRCTLEDRDYQLLRQIANADRMSMLLAMTATPMTAQELAHKLDLHPGSVFRDLNSMSNSNLLLKEVLGGKNTYRTNYSLLQKLFQKIQQMFDAYQASDGH